MRVLISALLVGCCFGQQFMQAPITIAGQQWTAYAFPKSVSPAVARIQKPGINFNLPQYPAVPVSASPIVAAPLPLVRSSIPVVAPAPSVMTVATPLQVPVVAPAPSVKTVATPLQVPVVAQIPAVFTPVVAYSGPAAAPVLAAPAATSAVVAVAPEPLQAPDPPVPSVGTPFVGGQFHSQDEAGQYTFGHWGGPNTRVETRDSFGRTAGSFAYVDPVGDVQVRKYAAAPASGFKVAASDLPVDNPEVAQVKAVHAKAFADAKSMTSSAAIAA